MTIAETDSNYVYLNTSKRHIVVNTNRILFIHFVTVQMNSPAKSKNVLVF